MNEPVPDVVFNGELFKVLLFLPVVSVAVAFVGADSVLISTFWVVTSVFFMAVELLALSIVVEDSIFMLLLGVEVLLSLFDGEVPVK